MAAALCVNALIVIFELIALDQACIDIVSQAQGNKSLMDRIERQNGIHTLEHAEEIGLGSRSVLMTIDAWAGVHPLLKTLPVSWSYKMPCGVLHSPEPSAAVQRFLGAIQQLYH